LGANPDRHRSGPMLPTLPTPIYPPEVAPASGRLQRVVLYVPRFMHHLRRRLLSHMGFAAAWQSTRMRMRDYR
jgi:signal transduction histidine kinase